MFALSARVVLGTLLGLATVLWVDPALALKAYMIIDGETQGPILGSVTDNGFEDTIEVLAATHNIIIPYDPGTGQPNGQPQHEPFRVVKLFDRASMPLVQALTSSERLDVNIRFIRADGMGGDEHYYTVDLVNAHLVERSESWAQGLTLHTEEVALVYQGIVWTWEIDGIQVSSEWTGSTSGFTGGGRETELALLPPSPNPTPGGTVLRFELPGDTEAKLNVFDVSGRRVRELFDGVAHPALDAVMWDGRNQRGETVANGVYIVKLDWSDGSATRRVTLLR